MEFAREATEHVAGTRVLHRADLAGKPHQKHASSVSTRAPPSENGTLASLSTLGNTTSRGPSANPTRLPLHAQSAAVEPEADELLEDFDDDDKTPVSETFEQDLGVGRCSHSSEQSIANTAPFLEMFGGDSDEDDCRAAFFSHGQGCQSIDFCLDSVDGSPDALECDDASFAFKVLFQPESDILPKDLGIPDVKIRNISHDALQDLSKAGSQELVQASGFQGGRPQSAPTAPTRKLLSSDQVVTAVGDIRVSTPPLPRGKPQFQHPFRRVVKSPVLPHASRGEQSSSTSSSVAQEGAAQVDGHDASSSIAGAPGQALLKLRRQT